MAETPRGRLTFLGKCPDCGERQVQLPAVLPDVGDDFDWRVRDYDGFRLFMLEELAARFPERRRWTPADMEVVLVEVLAAVLDQLSDTADRVASEATLETAQRPESVRRLLALIGYDAVRVALARGEIALEAGEGDAEAEARLEAFWRQNPYAMDSARRAGPRAIHTQRRMVTLGDYAQRLEEHPLVLRAHAWSAWSGSWNTLYVAVVGWSDKSLDQTGIDFPEEIRQEVEAFNVERDLGIPEWQNPRPTLRTLVRPYLDTYRLAAQEVILRDTRPVGITMAFSIQVASNYFQSEIRNAVRQALGTAAGGFFEPGRLRFGEDVHLSDLLQALMALDGVENVCFNRFKRLGSRFRDQVKSGRIVLEDLEIAVCDNDPQRPERGYYRLTLHGGRRG